MKQEDALKLLIEAINLAQARGAYNLKESAAILPGVEAFTNNNQNKNMNEDTNVIVGTPVVEAPVEEVTPTVDEGPESEVEATPAEEVAQPETCASCEA